MRYCATGANTFKLALTRTFQFRGWLPFTDTHQRATQIYLRTERTGKYIRLAIQSTDLSGHPCGKHTGRVMDLKGYFTSEKMDVYLKW